MNKKPVTQVVKWAKNANQSFKRTLSSSNAYASSLNSTQSMNNKQWTHPPDVLQFGQVEYTVKFLGDAEVSKPKGTEVIKEAIQKIRFNLQIQRTITGTSGAKLPKVELHINVEAVSVVDAKSKLMLYKYPLHRISFCADDKQDKRVFSFIAKEANSDKHKCFVFLSDKLAEEITLTIGEAFDLAYRKFLDSNGKDLEAKKSMILLRRRVSELEAENASLRRQLSAYQSGGGSLSSPPPSIAPSLPPTTTVKWESFESTPPPLPSAPIPSKPPPGLARPSAGQGRVPPSNGGGGAAGRELAELAANAPSVGSKLENLQLDSMEDLFDDDFDPRQGEKRAAASRQPTDPFGLNPFLNDASDRQSAVQNGSHALPASNGQSAQGAGSSAANGEREPTQEELESAIASIDSRLAEMREGFANGISFGNEDFGGGVGDLLSDFDPLAATPGSGDGAPQAVAN